MGIKYKLKLKDLKLEYLIDYFKPLLKYLRPKKKIENYQESGDMIVFDDYSPHQFPGVVKAVDEISQRYLF